MSLTKVDEKMIVRAFYDWIFSYAEEDDRIQIDLHNLSQREQLRFPLSRRSRPRSSTDTVGPTFLITHDRETYPSYPSSKGWATLFSSDAVTIWENMDRCRERQLRWGFTEQERNIAHAVIREKLAALVEKNEYQAPSRENLPLVFSQQSAVGVAFWVNGANRGSMIATGPEFNLLEAIIHATEKAYNDVRFIGISARELPLVCTELTLISDLKIPVTRDEMSRKRIDTTSAYTCYTQEGVCEGWYLPEVFNVKAFRSTEHFLESLATDKARITDSTADLRFYKHHVDDSIQLPDEQTARKLFGALIDQTFTSDTETKRIHQMYADAATWMLKNQRENGNYPVRFSPFSGSVKSELEWGRLSHAAWALYLYGTAESNDTCIASADRAYALLCENWPRFENEYSSNAIFTAIYFGHAAFTSGDTKRAMDLAHFLRERVSVVAPSPISAANLTTYFALAARHDDWFGALAVAMWDQVYASFLERKDTADAQPAEYAEMVVAGERLYGITNEQQHRRGSAHVADWLIENQLPSGALRGNMSERLPPYTTGTSKVFEVLAAEQRYEAESTRMLEWLYRLQFKTENLFSVDHSFRDRIHGAFRLTESDMHPQVDANSHVLIGAARQRWGSYDPPSHG